MHLVNIALRALLAALTAQPARSAPILGQVAVSCVKLVLSALLVLPHVLNVRLAMSVRKAQPRALLARQGLCPLPTDRQRAKFASQAFTVVLDQLRA